MLTIRLPVIVHDSRLPIIPNSDLEEIGSVIDINNLREPLAERHWLFRSGESSLFDLVQNAPLVPQNPGGLDWDYGHITFSSDYQNALVSDLSDMRDVTVALVWRRPAGIPNTVLLGTADTPSTNTGGGLNHHRSGGGVVSLLASARPFTPSVILPASTTQGWYFWAMSRGGGEGETTLRVFEGRDADPGFAETVYPGEMNLSGRSIALGNAYFSDPAWNNGHILDVAEFMIIPGIKSQTELREIYERSRARMLGSGITLI